MQSVTLAKLILLLTLMGLISIVMSAFFGLGIGYATVIASMISGIVAALTTNKELK